MTRIFYNSLQSISNSAFQQNLSDAQLGIDALERQFSDQALNSTNLLAMTAGGLTYRLARSILSPLFSALPSLLRTSLISALSLTAEVAAFRAVNHALSPSLESYWNRQGFTREMFSFASLKSTALLMQGSNPLTKHIAQSLGMMLGEELSAHLYLSASNEKSFAERFMNASATSLALGCGATFSSLVISHRGLIFARQFRDSQRRVLSETLPLEMTSEGRRSPRSNVIHSFVTRREAQLQRNRPTTQRILEPADSNASPVDPHYSRKVGEALDAYFENRATAEQMETLENDEMGRVILDSAGRL